MTDDAELSALIDARARATLVLLAAAHKVKAAGDPRHAAAAIERIAGTVELVDDDVLLKLAAINEMSEGLLSALIMVRAMEVGGALPLYATARDFFEPITQQVDAILRSARRHMH